MHVGRPTRQGNADQGYNEQNDYADQGYKIMVVFSIPSRSAI